MTTPTSEAEEPQVTVVIDSEKNDDWMKALPGYADETALHEYLAAQYATRNSGKGKRIKFIGGTQ